ncbi:MAG TPA: hypothetical protein VI911_11875 [Patescibacteria group bacterium]|nr:hypothetical protein [Patescibacteria group bacterium]
MDTKRIIQNCKDGEFDNSPSLFRFVVEDYFDIETWPREMTDKVFIMANYNSQSRNRYDMYSVFKEYFNLVELARIAYNCGKQTT